MARIIDAFPYTDLIKVENLTDGKMMTHQLEGVEKALQRFQNYRGFAYLFEMGTGKSLTAIYTWAVLYKAGLIKTGLVVCPKTALGVWKREIAKFLNVPVHVQVLDSKSTIYPQTCYNGKLVIYVINYDILKNIEKWGLKYDAVIADEGHKMKTPTTQQSKRMHVIGAASRFNLLLTGTAITNSVMDIFSQYQYMDSSIYGDKFYAWRKANFMQVGYGGYTWKVKNKLTMSKILAKMHSACMRVTKDEALDLPDVSHNIVPIALEPSARRLYEKLVKQDTAELQTVNTQVSQNVLERLLRLSQLCGGFHVGKDENDVKFEHQASTAKLEALEGLLEEAFSSRQKVCVFVRFRAEIAAIEELAKKMKVKYGVIHGGVSAEERTRIEDGMQQDDDMLLFIGQIKAASECITLTQAHITIFYSFDYSYVSFDQAKCRTHRNGQKEKCTYYYLLVEKSVDYAVFRAVEGKQQLAKFSNDDYRKMASGQGLVS